MISSMNLSTVKVRQANIDYDLANQQSLNYGSSPRYVKH